MEIWDCAKLKKMDISLFVFCEFVCFVFLFWWGMKRISFNFLMTVHFHLHYTPSSCDHTIHKLYIKQQVVL